MSLKRDISEFLDLRLPSTSQQSRSQVSLCNMCQMLQDDDIRHQIQKAYNNYDLREYFPLVGLALHIARVHRRPHKTKVLRIGHVLQTVDSQVLGNKWYYQSKGEVINCILPLFDEFNMIEVVNSKLFLRMMSLQLIDRDSEPQSYTILLNATLKYVLYQPNSTWRDTLINQICITSMMVLIKQTQFLQRYLDDILPIEVLLGPCEHVFEMPPTNQLMKLIRKLCKYIDYKTNNCDAHRLLYYKLNDYIIL